MYENLTWLARHQEVIEQRLFARRWSTWTQELFFYNVTLSYLEGEKNELADWGYNRDNKRGKKQIVIGLLCDQEGELVSTEVFAWNTADLQTFEAQVKKAVERFGCEQVTFVGDRGMIKSGQVEDLAQGGFHYITAITKPQIRSLIKQGVFQLGLFDEKLSEVRHEGVRYVTRCAFSAVRAGGMAHSQASRLAALKALAQEQNRYLAEHPKADQYKAWEKIFEKKGRLGLSDLVTFIAENRRIEVEVDEEYLAEVAELDGCYVIKTDLPAEAADTETVKARYKGLARVERAWSGLNLTVEEGLDHLKKLSVVKWARKAALQLGASPHPANCLPNSSRP
ncbi:MAG: transposase [Thermodesulfobacteriota bacterium]